ncbi:DUF6777 domain-containing protein [Kitasatospora sp. MAA19]|uniref:DUF6777 domain-containing protein n=1 Tax=Kitasatospora sp. MAA19 TaxID=3035090 RepID=UPI002476544B|nr:DUF6777 domain-containing protein [Kitasatospora sp. MAA19]
MVATVLIVNNQGGHNEAIPAANEVALQTPADPGPAPFTPSVETQGVSAPAPSQAPQPGQGGGSTATSPRVIHSVQGSSTGLYGGTMSKPSCDTERLITMVSTGDSGRAWASAAGIEQSAIPSYLRSLTSAYLRVDTRVTNHTYKSGASTEYQSVLQAGTAVLVDSQGVPRVRCACGNPLKAPVLVSDAKYTGKAWSGFQPTTLVVVVPAPQPVTEIILVNIETGGWFSRLTGRIEVVDRHVDPPKGPLAPGVPPPGKMTPTTPGATASMPTSSSGATSGSGPATTSGATSSGATSSGATSSGATSSGAKSSGATSSGATSSGATSSGATSSGAKSSGATSSGATSSGAKSSGASTGTGSAAATSSASSGTPSGTTKTAGPSSASTGSPAGPSTYTVPTPTPTTKPPAVNGTPTTGAPAGTTGTTTTTTAPKITPSTENATPS